METKRKRAQIPKIQEVTDEVGLVYKTNNCGDVVVLEYDTNKRIKIKFIDTGNQYVIQKDALEKGLIKDSIEILRAVSERQNNIEKERLLHRSLLLEKKLTIDKEKLEKTLRRQEESKARSVEADKRKMENASKRKEQNLKSYQELIGNTYSHSYFGEYQVTAVDMGKLPLCLQVKFSISGYETWANRGVVLRGSVLDKSRCEEESWKLITVLERAKSYQENREKQLSKAKQWQKDNPDKCRVRNQNRRAKRFELGGEVTLEELDNLMIEQDYKCANCKDELTDENKHMDHKIPIALKGTGDIGNIQWLCDYCNLSKNDKHPDLWAKVVATKEWWDIKDLRQGRCVSKEC